MKGHVHFKVFHMINWVLESGIHIYLRDFELLCKWYSHHLRTLGQVCAVEQLLGWGQSPIFLVISSNLLTRLHNSLHKLFFSNSSTFVPLTLCLSFELLNLARHCGLAKFSIATLQVFIPPSEVFHLQHYVLQTSSISTSRASMSVKIVSWSWVAWEHVVVGMWKLWVSYKKLNSLKN